MPKETEFAGLSNNFQKVRRNKNNGNTNKKTKTTEKPIVLGNFLIMNKSIVSFFIKNRYDSLNDLCCSVNVTPQNRDRDFLRIKNPLGI